MILNSLKTAVENIPEPAARALVHVPFSLRLGKHYEETKRAIDVFESFDQYQKKEFIFDRFARVISHAAAGNDFYRWFYREHGFSIDQLQGFDDISRVPIVTKADLRGWALDSRTGPMKGRFLANTGGTSGEPLEFYLSRDLLAREWAHMHDTWRGIGYRPTDLKLTLRGANLKHGRVLKFNAVHNEFQVNSYLSQEVVAEALRRLLERRTVRFLHGYPSTIYAFALHCADSALDLRDQLRSTLRGILLGSEYPAPVYRNVIEETFGVRTLSWYGHSEMAVFAREMDVPFDYHPMHSYGFAEAVGQSDGTCHLIGTSYFNSASPFIRYDTGDVVEPAIEGGLLDRFKISSGRVGDFVVDRNGSRISLTALIFGRHHKAFGVAKFVQVSQEHPGRMTLLVVPDGNTPIDAEEWGSLFDFSGVDIEVDFKTMAGPQKTNSGKVPLLVEKGS